MANHSMALTCHGACPCDVGLCLSRERWQCRAVSPHPVGTRLPVRSEGGHARIAHNMITEGGGSCIPVVGDLTV